MKINSSSYFFVTPHKTNVFSKLSSWSKPDCYIFDLQDGCPNDLKEKARFNIRHHAKQISDLGCQVLIRTNNFSNKSEFKKDMELLDLEFIDGVMLPHIENINDLVGTDKFLATIESKQIGRKNKIHLLPLIETVYSLKNLELIISSSQRISGVALGLYDLFAEMNAEMNAENVNFVTNTMILGAKGANLPFIDSPFIDVHNFSGFFTNCANSQKSGADGKMILHPDQIDIVNHCFSISEEERELLTKKIDNYNSGCDMNLNGEFIGPPIVKAIKNKLNTKTLKRVVPSNSVLPKVFKYGLDLDSVFEGQTITCPYEITMDDSWTTIWSSLVSMSNYIETSDLFSQEVGLKSKVMPFSAVLNLTLCMAVESYSESCLLHLGLEDVVYENPAYSGDTFKCYINIEKLRNTSDNKRSVITSTHVLINQNSQRILSFRRNTLFSFISQIDAKIGNSPEKNKEFSELLTKSKETQIADHLNWSKLPKSLCQKNSLNQNDLIIHDASRLISESENLAFTTLFRNTHPIHFNYLRYPKNEIVICGGFVLAVVLSNALKDFKQVVDQKIISCSHINKIGPNDTMSSVSYIHQTKVERNYEVITIKTIGLRNVDAAVELNTRKWPLALFDKRELRPAAMELLLQKEMPELFHKVCIQVLWKIWRPLNKANIT